MTTRAQKKQQELQAAPVSAATRGRRLKLPLQKYREEENNNTSTSAKLPTKTKSVSSAKMPPKRKNNTKKKGGTPAKKAKNGQPDSDEKSKRRRNWINIENVWLCKAFVNVSTDPTKGVGQKAETFWTNIKEVFDGQVKKNGFSDPEEQFKLRAK